MTTSNIPNNLVHKSRELNQLRSKDFDYYTYRIFCVAISKLNPFAPIEERVDKVRFSLKEYGEIVGLKNSVKPKWLETYAKNYNDKTGEPIKKQARAITQIGVTIPNDKNGFIALNVIRKFELLEEDGQFYVELTFEPELLEQVYGISKNFISYKLYNILLLKSYQQQRLYELLKQYQHQKTKEIDLESLKILLGIKKDAYPVWGDFSQKILKKAQDEFKESADIEFTFTPIKKGRKTTGVTFTIFENNSGAVKTKLYNEMFPYDAEHKSVKTDYSRNPLELAFETDDEKREYVEGYLETHFKDEVCKDYLVDVIPEDVHGYEEAKVEAIKNVAMQYVTYEQTSESSGIDRTMQWHTNLRKAVQAYTKQKWLPNHQYKVQKDVLSYFTSCFGYWLMDNAEH